MDKQLLIKIEEGIPLEPEDIERLILDQVKFVNFILKEAKKRNKILSDNLSMSYAKLIGLKTPYEEMIHWTRKIKREFDMYLSLIREHMMKSIDDRMKKEHRKKR